MKKELKEGFLNETDLIFNDISSEIEREYTFPNETKLLVSNPLYLNVHPKSGGHRLYTADKWSYYINIKESWYIRWRVKDGLPNFVK